MILPLPRSCRPTVSVLLCVPDPLFWVILAMKARRWIQYLPIAASFSTFNRQNYILTHTCSLSQHTNVQSDRSQECTTWTSPSRVCTNLSLDQKAISHIKIQPDLAKWHRTQIAKHLNVRHRFARSCEKVIWLPSQWPLWTGKFVTSTQHHIHCFHLTDGLFSIKIACRLDWNKGIELAESRYGFYMQSLTPCSGQRV